MDRPTQAEIALRLNVSKMTVSRALRGEKNVNEHLRGRILKVAEEMGYRPDPEISRMMTHFRMSRRKKQIQSLGFVWTDRTLDPASSWALGLLKGATQKASSLGYQLDEFTLKSGKMTARRVAEVMECRGIRGFVLSPLISRSRGHLSMPWEKFSCVMMGLGYTHPALDRVHHHHFLGMMTSLRQLRKSGFRKIGFFADAKLDQRMFGAWSSSFRSHHPLSTAGAEALMHLPKTQSKAGFMDWVRSAKPEIILVAGKRPDSWLQELPARERPLMATLNWSSDRPDLPGLDQQSEVLGATAVEMVVDRIHRNDRGVPQHPKLVMTAGVWREAGETAQPRAVE